LSNKDQKIQELEKAFADQGEASVKEVSDINNKLKLLFKEYEKALILVFVSLHSLPTQESLIL
jgi:hypothetical protein